MSINERFSSLILLEKVF